MLRSLTTRRTLPVALVAAGALLLAGCGGDDEPQADASESPDSSPSSAPTTVADDDGDGCIDFAEGGVSDTVTVSGAFGKAQPKVTFKKPLSADKVERSIATAGSGATTKKGDEVNAVVTAFLGSDGKSLGSQPIPITVGDSTALGAFAAGVDCVPLKSRVVVTVGASELYGPSGNPEAGIQPDDSVIIVTDVVGKVVPLKPAAWNDARLKVDLSGAKPKLTLPPGAPAKALLLKVLKQGTGDVVGKGDQVTVDYQGTSWNTKKIFDESYGKQPATFSTDGVVQGFGAALVGQKVGTQLVVTMPPKYAYGEGAINQADLKGQTLVFVIEIKATQPAAG